MPAVVTAGYLGRIGAKTTDATGGTEIGGVTQCNVDTAFAELATDNTKDAVANSGNRTRILGLLDHPIGITVDLDHNDAGQDILRAAVRSTIYVTFLPDGAEGFRYPCLVAKKGVSISVDGKPQQTFTLVSNGAATAATIL